MAQKSETPHDGGVSRNSCGGQFRESHTLCESAAQDWDPALVSHLREFVACDDATELSQRVALFKARSWAAHLMANYHSRLGVALAQDADWLAGQLVFLPSQSSVRLSMAAVACRRLVGAAMAVEFLHSEETFL